MKRFHLFCGLIACLLLGLYGCQPSTVSPADDDLTAARRGAALHDSLRRSGPKSTTAVAAADLPAAVRTYITTNYAGATIGRAAKNAQGEFIVHITQNNAHKLLIFNADGTFRQELAHDGKGRRNGPQVTRVDPAQLPAAIRTYISTNYAGATIQTAVRDSTRGYLVQLVQNGANRLLQFTLDGTFRQEVVRDGTGNVTAVAIADLPAPIRTYVTTNYATATIERAGKTPAGEFIVWLDVPNGPDVALLFAADGTFRQVLGRGRR